MTRSVVAVFLGVTPSTVYYHVRKDRIRTTKNNTIRPRAVMTFLKTYESECTSILDLKYERTIKYPYSDRLWHDMSKCDLATARLALHRYLTSLKQQRRLDRHLKQNPYYRLSMCQLCSKLVDA